MCLKMLNGELKIYLDPNAGEDIDMKTIQEIQEKTDEIFDVIASTKQ